MKNLALIFLSLCLFSSSTFADPIAPTIIGGRDLAADDPIAQSTVFIAGTIQRGSFSCTGIIYAPDLVITAGHCLGGSGYADLHVYFRTNKDGTGPIIHVKAEERVHDQLLDQEFDTDDIALLLLESPIPANYKPAKVLPVFSLLQNNSTITLAGYGRNKATLPDGDTNDGVGILRAVEQKVLQAKYGNTETLVSIQDKGACFGDSGGPGFLQIGKEYYVWGLAARLTDRDRLPDQGHQKRYGCLVDMVYTNLFYQKDWLIKAEQDLRQSHK